MNRRPVRNLDVREEGYNGTQLTSEFVKFKMRLFLRMPPFKANFRTRKLIVPLTIILSFSLSSNSSSPRKSISLQNPKSLQSVRETEKVEDLNSSSAGLLWFCDLGVTNAQPIGGWANYEKYIQDNIRFPKVMLEIGVNERVMVEFFVESSGNLSSLKVVLSSTPFNDSEALRLIKEGPAWMPSGNGKISRNRITIKFST